MRLTEVDVGGTLEWPTLHHNGSNVEGRPRYSEIYPQKVHTLHLPTVTSKYRRQNRLIPTLPAFPCPNK